MMALRCFRDDRRGNVAVIFAFASIPIILLSGMVVDYTGAGRREAKLNAIADAAALSTTTPTMMSLTPAQAQASAIRQFNAQAAAIPGVNWSSTGLSISVADTTQGTVVVRNTTVTYTATSTNSFSNLLQMTSINIGGTSKASSYVAPNIDFYLLLDTSPSMGIAATTDGINTMVANTKQQGGCAFACHETNPTTNDVQGNPHGEDNYALARQLGVPLRIDLVQSAVKSLMTTATATETANHSTYRVATYTFDASFNTITNLTSNLSQAQSDASNIQMLTVYSNGYLSANNANNDEDSAFDTAMSYSAYLPNPGNGTNQSGDKPQEVLFIVTDGVTDEAINNNRYIGTVGSYNDWCTPIKNKGIRIAFLYLTYNPLPTNGFYNQYVAPFQSSIPQAAQTCASPGLFFQVNTDGDITSAMNTLFQKAIATAHLTQ